MRLLFLLSVLALFPISSFAEKYLATSATLGGDAVISGSYVEMKDGSISFVVNVSSGGLYNLDINYKQNYGGSKTQNLQVNGSVVEAITFPVSVDWQIIRTLVRLESGNNTVAITKSWGWVDIEYIEITPRGSEIEPFDLDKNLVNSNANEAAKKVFAFMQENFQNKIISGVMTGDLVGSNNTSLTLPNQGDFKHIYDASGKYTALVGFDFMHSTGKNSEQAWYQAYSSATISMAKYLWDKGGIPAFCWHWKDPLQSNESFYTDGTSFDFTTACTNSSCNSWNTSSTAYKAIIADIDIVADLLKELQNSEIAVLWRPIHEASGGWFWWGAKGAAPFKLLYKLLYERLTNHHGLNNLIWVWNSEGADEGWYPGGNYVDIIGRDAYVDSHASLIGEFEKLKNLFGTKKMIALAENGPVPYPDNLIEDGAGWSYFMPWYGNYVTQSNSTSDWSNIMNHDYVITLEDMPGWGQYEIPPSISSSSALQGSSSSSSNEVELSSSSGDNSGDTNPITVLNTIPSAKYKVSSMGNGNLLIESNANIAIYLYNAKGSLAQKIQAPIGSSIVKLSVPAGLYVVKNAKTKQTQIVVVK